MINVFKSMAITFAMYSKLPVRSFEWEKENMKYCLLFLPVVGMVEGIFLLVFSIFFYKLKINPILIAAFITVLPICFNNFSKIYILAISYILIRAYSALSLVVFRNARGNGLAFEFADKSMIYVNRVVLLLFIVLTGVSMIIVNTNYGLLCSISTFLVFLYYRVKSFEEFGGITGDLAGYFLQLAELVVVLVLALSP